MFQSTPSDVPEDTTGSQPNSALFSALSTPSTERTEPLQAEPQVVVTKPQDAVTKPQDPVKKPQDAIAKPQDAIAKPQDTIAKPEKAVTRHRKELQPKSEDPRDDPPSSRSPQPKGE